MAARCLPNYEDVFLSLARLIENKEGQLNSSGFFDTLDFLVRPLDEYERTLSMLLARFRESYGTWISNKITESFLVDKKYKCLRPCLYGEKLARGPVRFE